MNADEAKREAVKALAARLRAWGVGDHFKLAENYVNDMALAGWIWMPPTNRHRPAKPGEDCRIHKGEWADICRSCAADRLAGDMPRVPPLVSVPPPVTYLDARRGRETDEMPEEGDQ